MAEPREAVGSAMNPGWLLLLLVIPAWGFVCNEKTHKQRVRLITARPAGPAFWDYSEEWRRVDYNAHMWRLMTFRDPRKLYGPLTQRIWPQ